MNNGLLVDHGTLESLACLFRPDRCSAPGTVPSTETSVPAPADSASSDNLDPAPGTGFITSSATTYCGVAVPAKSITGVVTSVHDGDTIKIGSTNIRLEGIDAPELAQTYGVQSRDNLRALVNGQTVTVYYNKIDRFGRTVGAVFNNSCVNVNLQQVRTGSAWHYKQYQCEQSAGARSDFAAAQIAADIANRGLWAFSATSPWVYRNGTDPTPPKCSSDNPSWYTATTIVPVTPSVPVTPVTTVTPPSAGPGTASPVTPVSGCREVWVNGYTRKDGTTVRGHYRTIC
jgi:endonuclease YncB( thermonuclease family)